MLGPPEARGAVFGNRGSSNPSRSFHGLGVLLRNRQVDLDCFHVCALMMSKKRERSRRLARSLSRFASGQDWVPGGKKLEAFVLALQTT